MPRNGKKSKITTTVKSQPTISSPSPTNDETLTHSEQVVPTSTKSKTRVKSSKSNIQLVSTPDVADIQSTTETALKEPVDVSPLQQSHRDPFTFDELAQYILQYYIQSDPKNEIFLDKIDNLTLANLPKQILGAKPNAEAFRYGYLHFVRYDIRITSKTDHHETLIEEFFNKHLLRTVPAETVDTTNSRLSEHEMNAIYWRVKLRYSSLILATMYLDLLQYYLKKKIDGLNTTSEASSLNVRNSTYCLSLNPKDYTLGAIHYYPHTFHYVNPFIQDADHNKQAKNVKVEPVELLEKDGLTSIHYILQTKDLNSEEQLIVDICSGELNLNTNGKIFVIEPISDYMLKYQTMLGEITEYVKVSRKNVQHERLSHSQRIKSTFDSIIYSILNRQQLLNDICTRCGAHHALIKPSQCVCENSNCDNYLEVKYCSTICQKLDLNNSCRTLSSKTVTKETISEPLTLTKLLTHGKDNEDLKDEITQDKNDAKHAITTDSNEIQPKDGNVKQLLINDVSNNQSQNETEIDTNKNEKKKKRRKRKKTTTTVHNDSTMTIMNSDGESTIVETSQTDEKNEEKQLRNNDKQVGKYENDLQDIHRKDEIQGSEQETCNDVHQQEEKLTPLCIDDQNEKKDSINGKQEEKTEIVLV